MTYTVRYSHKFTKNMCFCGGPFCGGPWAAAQSAQSKVRHCLYEISVYCVLGHINITRMHTIGRYSIAYIDGPLGE